MKKPVKNQILYTVFNGKLERYRFLEESVAAGACTPTWLIRSLEKDGRQLIRCSVGMYELTEREAWQKWLDELFKGCQRIQVFKKKLDADIRGLKQSILNVKTRLRRCPKTPA